MRPDVLLLLTTLRTRHGKLCSVAAGELLIPGRCVFRQRAGAKASRPGARVWEEGEDTVLFSHLPSNDLDAIPAPCTRGAPASVPILGYANRSCCVSSERANFPPST